MRTLLAALTGFLLAVCLAMGPAAAQVPPIQPPPGMAPNGSNAQLPAAATNLSKWTIQTHQNSQTGSCYGTGSGRVLCASDQNFDLTADHSTIQTQDASMITYLAVGGSKTTADVVGLNWTVATTLYQIRYTVQAGDTLTTIAANLAACINAGGAADCTVTAGFLNGLLAFQDANGFGYMPRAAVTATATKIAFDQPWAASGNSVATFLSGGATETLTLTGGTQLDIGPYMATTRLVPGWTPTAGSQLGGHYFQGQSAANSGIDTQYGLIFARVLLQDATNPQGELLFATSDSGSAKNNNPKLYIGNGIATADSVGANSCGYLGLGTVSLCGQVKLTSGTNTQWFGQATGAADWQEISDTGTTGTNNYRIFRYRGGNKVQIGQFGANTFSITDVSGGPGNNASPFSYNTSTGLTTIAGEKELQVTKTGNYTVLSTDSNTFFDNTGAGGEVDFTLPTYAAGLRYCFAVTAAQILKVIAPASNRIAIGVTNSVSAGNITASAVYSTICLYATPVANQWAAKSSTGSWTVN